MIKTNAQKSIIVRNESFKFNVTASRNETLKSIVTLSTIETP